MITYLGMSFCPRTECLKFSSCHRAYTDSVRADAIKWWGSDSAPVAIMRFTDCFVDSAALMGIMGSGKPQRSGNNER